MGFFSTDFFLDTEVDILIDNDWTQQMANIRETDEWMQR